MIRLSRARLVNWHYFRDTSIEIGERTLISGDNGMGKSTIVDAIQYALAADLRKARFNQAAGDRRGGRDLTGYVRCKIGSDSTEYLRKGTVSHIMLRFDSGETFFTAGVCVEAFTDGRTTERFWIGDKIDDATLTIQEENKKPLTWRQFRDRLEKPGVEFYESKREYLRNLTDRLGVFRRMSEYNPYLEAFTRSVSFTPLVSVDRFVCDYILEDRPLSIQTMKENLESYKEAERQAHGTVKKIIALREIRELAEEFRKYQATLTRQEYLKHHIDLLLAREALEKNERSHKETEQRCRQLSGAIAENGLIRERLESELREVDTALARDDNHTLYRRLQERIQTLERDFHTARSQAETCALLRKQCALLLDETGPDDETENDEAGIDRDMERMEAARSASERALHQAEDTLALTETALRDAASELSELERGIRRFPGQSLSLVQTLQTKGVEAWILADLAEVTAPDWANAIEGWLNTLRFAVIVEPLSFQKALAIYNAQPSSLAGVALPNIAKLRDRSAEVRKGSLAELVSSDNPWARIYLQAMLGNVMTADITTLKNYEKAVTRECMSYGNHTAIRIKEDVWKDHWLGQAGRERRRDFLRDEITRLRKEKEVLEKEVLENRERSRLFTNGVRSLAQARSLAGSREKANRLEAELDEANTELSSIDISASIDLGKKREELNRRIQEEGKTRDTLTAEEGKSRAHAELLTEKAFILKGEVSSREDEYKTFCTTHEADLGECEEYAADRLKHAEPREIADTYDSSRKGLETRSEKTLAQYRKKVAEYGNHFNALVSVEIGDCPSLLEILERLERSELPEYQDRIIRARQDAEKEFREHFIAKLNEYILEARESFREINATLKALNFGHDQYSFTLEERIDRRGQIKIVQKAAEITGFDGGLFEQIVDPVERKETEALFENIVNADLDSPEMRNICDYRTYFTYDIRIRDTQSVDPATGKAVELSLSRVLREKSGGEAQTPYYVAIAASFYRFFKDKPESIVRFVLFDEAFDKLDDERIRKVIDFYANMGIQLMVAVPPGKIEAIAPLMDQVHIVSRLGHDARVREFRSIDKGNP